MEDKFQTAFPEDTQPEPEGTIMCINGCGRPAKYGELRPGINNVNDPPRCEKRRSDCPLVTRTAIRAAKKAGRLGRRWRSRF